MLAGRAQEGQTTLVTTSQPVTGPLSAEVGALVKPTGEPERSSGVGVFGREPLLYVSVAASVTVEVATDGVHEHGRLRHAVRVDRVRPDLSERRSTVRP